MHARSMQTSTCAARRKTAPHAMRRVSEKPNPDAAEIPLKEAGEHVEPKSLRAQKPGNQALAQGYEYLAHEKGFFR